MDAPDTAVELINPPNALKKKVGGKIAPADPKAIANAEAALDTLKGQFLNWLEEEVDKLLDALVAVRQEGVMAEAGEAFFTAAHDLRGLGSTYQIPIISRLAGSLAKMLETEERRARAPLALIEAHAEAIGAALRQNIRSAEDPVGQALAEELERQAIEIIGEDE